MSYLFLLNAGISVLLGFYPYLHKRNSASFRLLVFNLGFACWNICVFLVNVFPERVDVDLIVRLQLVASMVLANGLFYFCTSYPVYRRSPLWPLNALAFSLLTGSILFTDRVTSAALVEGVVVYGDNVLGFSAYFVYVGLLSFGALAGLISSYRKYPEFQEKIKYLFVGLGVFVSSIAVFNILLPLAGIYGFLIIGRLSGMVPALCFAYVITKHDFMDMTVVINKKVSWAITLCLMGITYAFAYTVSEVGGPGHPVLLFLFVVFWAVAAAPVQQFLLTTARRKFIRSWYDPEDVISEIADQLTIEKNREAIFMILERVLDDVFQLETSQTVIAIRDDEEKISLYRSSTRSGQATEREELDPVHDFILSHEKQSMPRLLEDCPRDVQAYLRSKGFQGNGHCLVVPFYSPEYLEGIVVMGERSTQASYTRRDIRFMERLVNYISAILYRLTPFEKLEKLYFENRQKLHDAEIQLIRAQKIEAIVHATRQCHHEIRTPLNIIKLGIGRIHSLDDLESYRRIADEEVSRALEIIDETLTITDVSKMAEDRFTWFDLNEALKRSARVVDTERYELNLNLGALPEIYGVFSDIQVVVTNLIHNALEAMPGGGSLDIRSFQRDNSIIIEIADTGFGIEEKLRSRVWEPYFSGQETEVGNSTVGRGWGLTIVNRIVTEHHGTIRLQSTVGVGTTFTITLPVRRRGAENAGETVSDGAGGETQEGNRPRTEKAG